MQQNTCKLTANTISTISHYSSVQETSEINFSKSWSNRPNKMICHYCQKQGHIMRDCFLRKRHMSESAPNTRTNRGFNNNGKSSGKLNSIFTIQNITSSKSGKLCFVECRFFDCHMIGLADISATVSLISKDFLNRNKLNSSLRNCSHSAEGFDRKKGISNFSKSSTGSLEIGGETVETSLCLHLYRMMQ